MYISVHLCASMYIYVHVCYCMLLFFGLSALILVCIAVHDAHARKVSMLLHCFYNVHGAYSC